MGSRIHIQIRIAKADQDPDPEECLPEKEEKYVRKQDKIAKDSIFLYDHV
jgi:hypothetical protein